jgi:hypothetical protein
MDAKQIKRARQTADCWNLAAEELAGVSPADAQELMAAARQLAAEGPGRVEEQLGIGMADLNVLHVAYAYLTTGKAPAQPAESEQ